MSKLCGITKSNIGIIVLSFIMKIILWSVTVLSIYALKNIKKFRERASNIIIVNILITDSLSTLTSGIYGTYLRTCKSITYQECTTMIVASRTFAYISVAFMVFFSIERYCKVTKPPLEYNILFSKNRINYSIAAIWILFTFFSITTTPFWIYLTTPELSHYEYPFCTFSTVMEPLVGIITIFLANILPTIFLVWINVVLAVKVRTIFVQTEKKINLTDVQKDRNKEIVKKVELNIFIMCFTLTLINLSILGVYIYDMVAFFSYLLNTNSYEDFNASKLLTILIFTHPMLEAVTCFLLNKDMMELFWSLSSKKSRLYRKETAKTGNTIQ